MRDFILTPLFWYQEISVVHCVASEVINPGSLPQAQQQVHNISFIAIDMYAKLVVIILKVNLALNVVMRFYFI